MDVSRRAALMGLAAAAFAGPAAALPRSIERHPGFQAWSKTAWPQPLPLSMAVRTAEGAEVALGEWLGTGPSVLILWAHWCAPCLVEKPPQALLSRRLKTVGSSTSIKALQAFDDIGPAEAQAGLDRLGARGLDIARASPAMEQAFLKLFGPSVNDGRRTALPSLMLLDAEGKEIARAKGTLASASGQSYWGDVMTFQFLSTLEQRLKAPS